MRRFTLLHTLPMIATAIVLLTTSCQKDDLYDGKCKVRFVSDIQDEVTVTRADGYTPITEDPGFIAGLFVSYGSTAPEYALQWQNDTLSADIHLETGDYFFGGYAPQKDSVRFEPRAKTMEIPNIPGLTTEDVLVIAPNSTTVSIRDISARSKTIALQMDHLLARVTPHFYINSEYAHLRDIHITKVEFILDNAATYTATINYNVDPYRTTWTANNTTDLKVSLFESEQNVDTLLTTAVAYGTCYVSPAQTVTDNLSMKVTYDVYDKEGTKIRADQTATNLIKKLPATLTAGKNYNLKIQIIPTYLYVLSDDDEDSVLVIKD